MSALAAGLCAIEKELTGLYEHDDFYRKASFLSRLGSGSASRSVYGKMAVWGRTAAWKDASDEYAIPVLSMHNDFEGMKDSILIIESGEKEVSSSLGHDLMKTNRYAETRFEVAENNMQRLAKVLEAGDMGQFIDIMEYEALQLHAMMMTSTPSYVLMKPNTLEAISRIRRFRRETGTAIGFTLDAGANVHVLYPANEKEKARAFIREELASLCENGRVIEDEMGEGTTEV